MNHTSDDDDFEPAPIIGRPKVKYYKFTRINASKSSKIRSGARRHEALKPLPPKCRNASRFVPASEDEGAHVAADEKNGKGTGKQMRKVFDRRRVDASETRCVVPDSEEERPKDKVDVLTDNVRLDEMKSLGSNSTSIQHVKLGFGLVNDGVSEGRMGNTDTIQNPESLDSAKPEPSSVKSRKRKLLLARRRPRSPSNGVGLSAELSSQAGHKVMGTLDSALCKAESQGSLSSRIPAIPTSNESQTDESQCESSTTSDTVPELDCELPPRDPTGDANPLLNISKPDPFVCPVCNAALALRYPSAIQAHVNACLDSTATTKHSDSFTPSHHALTPSPSGSPDPFSSKNTLAFCPLCGKDLTFYSSVRRTQHLNRCLDDLAAEEALLTTLRERDAARGSDAEVLLDSPVCPCCRAPWPGRKRTGRVMKGRIAHVKACAAKRGVEPGRMVALLRWLKFGFEAVPLSEDGNVREITNSKRGVTSVSTKPTLLSPVPSPFAHTTIPNPSFAPNLHTVPPASSSLPGADVDADSEVDFQPPPPPPLPTPFQTVMTVTRRRRDDALDEDLQVALTLSRSMALEKERLGRGRKRRALGPGVTTVVSVEEAKERIGKRVEEVLRVEMKEVEEESGTPQFEDTRVGKDIKRKDGVSYWEMATTWGGYELEVEEEGG
ncbi:hypothetical protein BC937DRAFT_93674 [Endogone sp. FLAS-F59071]|nr:hypothetical protein BC937DRAFT_93674 [Endogone sp. FLAS-F59071]|eukprot:RUS14531.1 hypothetical protein BC937DRAFT_93674 [Endogone sp. FLAS-F59071]